jgi:hypothetical protein
MCCPKRGILGIALEITGIQILPECLLDIRYCVLYVYLILYFLQ